MTGKVSDSMGKERAISPDRRRFLQAAAGAGLALGMAAGRTAFGGPLGSRVRVGLIGTDGHTGVILGSIPRLSGVELTAFAKSRPDDDASGMKRNRAFTDKTRIYDRYEEMLEKEELDIVAVCLPYYRNAGASIAAAKKGINIVSEKPVATTLKDLEALKKAVQRAGVRLTSMMNMRCGAPYRAARKAVLGGAIGEPILVTSQKSYKFGAERPWFYKESDKYGGTIPWVGIHAIDYMRWTTGREYVSVTAWQGNKAHPAYPGCEDHAGVLFKLDNGGTAMSNLDYLRPEAAPTHGDDRLRIAGSEGVVEVMGAEGRAFVITPTREPYDLELPGRIDFFGDYLAELRGEGEHLISQDDAFRLTEVCLKARNTAGTGKWMEV
jgi:predicted dehydrogenase